MRFRIVEDIHIPYSKYGWTNSEQTRSDAISQYIISLLNDEDNYAEESTIEEIPLDDNEDYIVRKCRLVDKRGKTIPGTIHYRAADHQEIADENMWAYKTFKDAKHKLEIIKKLNGD